MRDVVPKHALRVWVGDLCGALFEHCVHRREQRVGTRVVRCFEYPETGEMDAQRLVGAVGTAATGEIGKKRLDVGTRPVHISFGELDARKSGLRLRCDIGDTQFAPQIARRIVGLHRLGMPEQRGERVADGGQREGLIFAIVDRARDAECLFTMCRRTFMVASVMRDDGEVEKGDTLELPVSERASKVQTLFEPSRGGLVVSKPPLRVAEIVEISRFRASVTQRLMKAQALLQKMVSRRRVAVPRFAIRVGITMW